ncbi:MAG: D-aminoacyl-tRNA deacylase [Actinomycetota bacterium]|nr:D-aminoacyl-tRNA deacylase [Actinomycetota bacterium]
MRALVQRVDSAHVDVAGQRVGGIDGPGLVVLVGVTHTDTPDHAARLAGKVYHLRIFDADGFAHCRLPSGAREVSAADLGLPVLVVSQFTLYGSAVKGRRPTWEAAAPAETAEPLVAEFADQLTALGATVATGSFGADMRVTMTNDGPFTLLLEV